MKLKLVDFCGSVERLAWAKDNGCPWEARTCAYIATGGQLEVLVWGADARVPVECIDVCTRR